MGSGPRGAGAGVGSGTGRSVLVARGAGRGVDPGTGRAVLVARGAGRGVDPGTGRAVLVVRGAGRGVDPGTGCRELGAGTVRLPARATAMVPRTGDRRGSQLEPRTRGLEPTFLGSGPAAGRGERAERPHRAGRPGSAACARAGDPDLDRVDRHPAAAHVDPDGAAPGPAPRRSAADQRPAVQRRVDPIAPAREFARREGFGEPEPVAGALSAEL